MGHDLRATRAEPLVGDARPDAHEPPALLQQVFDAEATAWLRELATAVRVLRNAYFPRYRECSIIEDDRRIHLRHFVGPNPADCLLALRYGPPRLLVAVRERASDPRVFAAPLMFRVTAARQLVVGPDGLGPSELARLAVEPWLLNLIHEYGRTTS